MSGRRFLAVAVVGLAVAATCLAMAGRNDSPILYGLALASIVTVLMARESWFWRGDLRGWLTTMGGIALAVLVSFVLVTIFD